MQPLFVKSIAVAATVVTLAGCRSGVQHQTDARRLLAEADGSARAAGLADEEIVAAKQLYLTKCARCHKFYDPANYAAPEWDSWMNKMAKKSKLTPDQHAVLSRYLDAFRNKPTTPAP